MEVCVWREGAAPAQWVGSYTLPQSRRPSGTEPEEFLHNSARINTQEHALHANTLESSPKVRAHVQQPSYTQTHTHTHKHTHTGMVGETLLTLTGPTPAPYPRTHPHTHTHTHTHKHTHLHASSSSLTAELEQHFQNCWSAGNVTLRPAESDIHTHTHTHTHTNTLTHTHPHTHTPSHTAW